MQQYAPGSDSAVPKLTLLCQGTAPRKQLGLTFNRLLCFDRNSKACHTQPSPPMRMMELCDFTGETTAQPPEPRLYKPDLFKTYSFLPLTVYLVPVTGIRILYWSSPIQRQQLLYPTRLFGRAKRSRGKNCSILQC